jgi:hypothetical protein
MAYYGFCSQECYNTFITRRNSGQTGYTAMQGQGREQPKNKIKINDILKNGKMQGTLCMDGFNFAFVCDQMIDPEMFAKAAIAFRDTFKT